jgi:hypothetical protein
LKTHVLPFLPLPSPPSPFFGDRVEKSRAGLDLVWEIAGQVGTLVEKSRAGLEPWWRNRGPGCDYQKRERSNGVPRVNSNFIFYPPG